MKTEFFETPFDIDNKYRNTMYMRKEGSKICTACRVSAAEIYLPISQHSKNSNWRNGNIY